MHRGLEGTPSSGRHRQGIYCSPRTPGVKIAHGNSEWPAQPTLDEKEDSVGLHVEYINDRLHFSPGSIVAFEFVSNNGRWMWSIGTVLSASDDDTFKAVDAGLVPLLCWKVTQGARDQHRVLDHRRELNEVGEKSRSSARERSGGSSRDTYVNDVLRKESAADAVRTELKCVSKAEWGKFLDTAYPTRTVLHTLRALFAFLRIDLNCATGDSEWEEMKAFLSSHSFAKYFHDPCAVRLNESLVDTLIQKYINNPRFSLAPTSSSNRVVALLQKWITGEVYLFKARASLATMDEQVENACVGAEPRRLDQERYSTSVSGLKVSSARENQKCTNPDVIRTFTEDGAISFVRSSEATVILRTSIFCKIDPSGDGGSQVLEMTLKRDLLARIRSAALHKFQRPARVMPNSPSSGGVINTSATEKITEVAKKSLLNEESLQRKRLMLLEIETLLRLHVSYAAELHRQMSKFITARAEGVSSVRSAEQKTTVDLLKAQRRVERLEQNLREKEQEIQAMQHERKKEVKHLVDELEKAKANTREVGILKNTAANLDIIYLEHEEETARMSLQASADQGWMYVLLQEMRKSKDLDVADVALGYMEEIGTLHRELEELQRSQHKAVAILEGCLSRAHGMQLQHEEQQSYFKEELLLYLEDVESALEALGTHKPSIKYLFNSHTRNVGKRPDSPAQERRGLPQRTRAPPTTHLTGNGTPAQESLTDINDNDVILLKDRLVEAIHDRELIQEMFNREQERNQEMEKKKMALSASLEQETEARKKLEKMVVSLQGEIERLTEALRAVKCKKREVWDRKRHNLESSFSYEDSVIGHQGGSKNRDPLNGSERLEGLSHEHWLATILEMEGIKVAGDPVTALHDYILHLRDKCASTVSERDAQAAEARMLENCLKSAADALENALIHDERWKPRVTDSQHTTRHSKAFVGCDWGRVISNSPGALTRAIVHDVAAACHLPEAYVLNMEYCNGDDALYVTFDLRHDPSITKNELERRLSECNFHEIDKLYAGEDQSVDGVDELRGELQSSLEEIKQLREALEMIQANAQGACNSASAPLLYR
ncbi:hypothetical protein ERJ75_001738400 [Trypanosoma vivax]|nr:hypothetical protein ERJ75_001738400 [Trypanosoma vivax]